jgi:hypothetical protein
MGESEVCPSHDNTGNELATALCASGAAEVALSTPDAETDGWLLFISRLTFSMHPISTQVIQHLDVMSIDKLLERQASASADPSDEQDPTSGSVSVGALVLRGNRCILVRSLEQPKQWHGVRIPRLIRDESDCLESDHDLAVRAFEEQCDVDGDEVQIVEEVPPLPLYLEDGATVMVHVLYATSAPPGGSGEQSEVVDPDSEYDWFTFTGALARVSDAEQRMLKAAAYSLAAAAHAGRLPNKWGGVFGQEFAR